MNTNSPRIPRSIARAVAAQVRDLSRKGLHIECTHACNIALDAAGFYESRTSKARAIGETYAAALRYYSGSRTALSLFLHYDHPHAFRNPNTTITAARRYLTAALARGHRAPLENFRSIAQREGLAAAVLATPARRYILNLAA